MPYTLIYSPQAEEDLGRLPVELWPFLEAELLELGKNPVQRSRPSAFPYPANCQLYTCTRPKIGEADPEHHFAVLFRFGQDESTLLILGIGHVEY